MNKYSPHVYVVPEDDANRQIADGFALHHGVHGKRMQVVPPIGGWSKVLKTFQDEYVNRLREYPHAHVVLLVDFDDQVESRKVVFDKAIPAELSSRVFVVGSKLTPEALKSTLKRSYEDIGSDLAQECDAGTDGLWGHEQLRHNDPDRLRMVQAVRPFLFSRE